MQTLSAGSTLQDGKYKILQVLGQGGFGITYLAEHELLGTKVAIKEFFFKQYCDRDPFTSHVTIGTTSNIDEVKRYEEKFLKEARIIAKLNHPNIIKIHDVFRENNTAYYVMDYIEGENLSDMVQHQGALPEAEAVGYIQQAGDALSYIHEQHLNHLDIKPANMMLRKTDGKVILIDFGMSKQYDTTSGNQTSTTPVGISHGYAPIEQYKEGGVGEFSPQTDIYALGATLYKLVTGNTPPQAGDIINDGLPILPSTISKNVKFSIEKAMEIKKVQRPDSILAFFEILNPSVINPIIQGQNENTVLINSTINLSSKEEDKTEVFSTSKTKKYLSFFVIIVVIIGTLLFWLREPFQEFLSSIGNEGKEKELVHAVFHSTPSNVEVYIDDIIFGVTPLSVKIPLGSHTFTYKKKGYKQISYQANVTSINDNSYYVDLAKDNSRE